MERRLKVPRKVSLLTLLLFHVLLALQVERFIQDCLRRHPFPRFGHKVSQGFASRNRRKAIEPNICCSGTLFIWHCFAKCLTQRLPSTITICENSTGHCVLRVSPKLVHLALVEHSELDCCVERTFEPILVLGPVRNTKIRIADSAVADGNSCGHHCRTDPQLPRQWSIVESRKGDVGESDKEPAISRRAIFCLHFRIASVIVGQSSCLIECGQSHSQLCHSEIQALGSNLVEFSACVDYCGHTHTDEEENSN